MQKLGGEFEGVVVAQVFTRDKHPNADKLSLCRVNDGKGERQIVCGAQNFKAGRQSAVDSAGGTLAAKAGQPPLSHQSGQNPRRGIAWHDVFPAGTGICRDTVEGLLILRRGRQSRPAVRRLSGPG